MYKKQKTKTGRSHVEQLLKNLLKIFENRKKEKIHVRSVIRAQQIFWHFVNENRVFVCLFVCVKQPDITNFYF